MSEPIFPRVMATGHRPQALTEEEQLWSKKELKKTLLRLRKFHGAQEIISGMALGVDTWWAEGALELGLPLAAYIPFETQAERWTHEQRQRWQALRSAASRELVLGDHYQVWLLHARNDAMIRDSELCVAVWKESKLTGGTFSAVQKVRKLNKPLILLNPEQRSVRSERLR